MKKIRVRSIIIVVLIVLVPFLIANIAKNHYSTKKSTRTNTYMSHSLSTYKPVATNRQVERKIAGKASEIPLTQFSNTDLIIAKASLVSALSTRNRSRDDNESIVLLGYDCSDMKPSELELLLSNINERLVTNRDSSMPTLSKGSVEMRFGSLDRISITDDGIVIMLVTIKPSWTNKATIEQNFYNIENFISNYGCDDYNAVKYTAQTEVSDTRTGKTRTAMVIQFIVPKDTLCALKNGTIYPNELHNYVDDLWISPILQ